MHDGRNAPADDRETGGIRSAQIPGGGGEGSAGIVPGAVRSIWVGRTGGADPPDRAGADGGLVRAKGRAAGRLKGLDRIGPTVLAGNGSSVLLRGQQFF